MEYKIRTVELETVCGVTSRLPQNEKPEVAFAGRSNVGKSSLINALMNRKALARVSQKPGKTQTINFYHINNGVTPEAVTENGFAPDLYLVDLPGYGYAGVPEAEKAKWGPMIERYLHGSKMLKAVFLLLDLRHEPTKDDLRMIGWIRDNGFSPVIVATKADKLKKQQKMKNLQMLRKAAGIGPNGKIAAFSALTKEGLEDVRRLMSEAVMPQTDREAESSLWES